MRELRRSIVHSAPVIYLFHYPSVFLGLIVFILTRKTPWLSYWSMRKIYAYEGRSCMDRFSKLSTTLDYKTHATARSKSSIFEYTAEDVRKISKNIESEGYCVLPYQLPEVHISELKGLATSAQCVTRQAGLPGRHRVNLDEPIAPIYAADEADLIKNKTAMTLAQDSLFLDIAEGYLKQTPINDLITLSWSFPHKNPDRDLLAWMYHFDLDRFKFLKFFFYLTDVEKDTGPHCFIKGSHTNKAKFLTQDRRYTDEEIYAAYGAESEVIMTGKKGLILVEDTRGFHKGLDVIRGHRLILQLEYTTSLFGQGYRRFDMKETDQTVYEQMKKEPTVWQRFI